MDWYCFDCHKWVEDTVCSDCLQDSPHWAREGGYSSGMFAEWDFYEMPKLPYAEREVKWYRLLMTGRRT